MSEHRLTIWRFVHSTSNRFVWSVYSIRRFSSAVRHLGRALDLKLQMVFDQELGAETPAYPLELLERVAREQKASAISEFKTLGFLLIDLALELDPGQHRTMRPAEICERAIDLRLAELVAPGETSQSKSLQSRMGKALTAAAGKCFDDLNLTARGRSQHRRYTVSRLPN